MTFKEIGLDEQLLEALSYMGFEKATPIQEEAIPAVLKGQDLLACAQTGTGKTAAFILPVINQLIGKKRGSISALVIAPTRELAIQIEQEIQAFAYFANLSSIAVYGGGDGNSHADQKKALSQGVDIVVATPGKFIAHMKMNYVNLKNLKYLILDEADRMLDMGFNEDIMYIVEDTPKERQTLLFSATMPPKIRKLAGSILKDQKEISLAISKPAAGVLQAAYLISEDHKAMLIRTLIHNKLNYSSIIVFSSTKKKVSTIVRALRSTDYGVQAISSDLDQEEREFALRKFRAQETRVLVATDVLSRGIDIKGINLVINYDVPGDAEDYVHRIGRTARADATGVAITLINEDDMAKFAKIEALIESEVMKLPVPENIGPTLTWNPNSRKRSYRSGGRGGYKKKRYSRKK